MDVFDRDVAYAILALFGTVAVAIHAHWLYGQPPPNAPKDADVGLLSSIPIAVRSGRRYFYRGFAFYLAVSETVYLILAFSSGILVTTLTAIGRTDAAGAISGTPELNPMVPIIASSVIISASQVRPIAEVEQAFRRIAHRLAGIPDNVHELRKKIVDALDELPEASGDGSSGAVVAAEADAWATDAGRRILPDVAGADREERRERLIVALREAYCLHEWTVGAEGREIWIGRQTEEILTIGATWSEKEPFEDLRDDVDRIGAKAGRKGRADVLDGILRRCRALRHKQVTLLALLLLNKPEIRLDKHPALERVKNSSLRREFSPLINAQALSVATGGAAAVFALSLYMSGHENLRSFVRADVDPAKLGPAYLDNARSPTPGTLLLNEIGGSDGLSPFTRTSIEDALKRTWTSWGEKVRDATWEVFNYLVVFALSTSVALVVRDARLRQGVWFRRRGVDAVPPVLQYLSLGLIGYVLAASVFVIVNFVKLAVLPAFATNVPVFSSINLLGFTQELPRLLLFPLASIGCIWFVCSRLDRAAPHPDGRAEGPARPPLSRTFLGLGIVGAVAAVVALPAMLGAGMTLALFAALVAIPLARFLGRDWPALLPQALLFGGAIGSFNIAIRLTLGTVSNGWTFLEVAFYPTVAFTAFFVAFAVIDGRFELGKDPEVLPVGSGGPGPGEGDGWTPDPSGSRSGPEGVGGREEGIAGAGPGDGPGHGPSDDPSDDPSDGPGDESGAGSGDRRGKVGA